MDRSALDGGTYSVQVRSDSLQEHRTNVAQQGACEYGDGLLILGDPPVPPPPHAYRLPPAPSPDHPPPLPSQSPPCPPRPPTPPLSPT